MSEPETCSNCRFGKPVTDDDGLYPPEIYAGLVLCRRYSPSRSGIGFPPMRADVWCGEYERSNKQ